ncbi:hypothetical protein D3C79_754280 [compost metagenome]
MFDNIRQTIEPLPAITNRIVCVFPSKSHVQALQRCLGDAISQEAPIDWDEFHNDPEAFTDPDRIIFMECHSVGEATLRMPAKATFLSREMFVMADGKVLAIRDQTGRKWRTGSDPDGTTADSFKHFDEFLARAEADNAS